MRPARLFAIAVAAGLALAGCGGTSGDPSLGSTGKPVHLVVGYQPYYTEAWSALVLREKQFWKRYLPKGSTVDFAVGLQGSIIIGQMLAGKEEIGYTGDMPSIVGVSKRSTGDLRIVATAGVSDDQCGIFLVRKDAPAFASETQALAWLDGKVFATPQGSCTDRVSQEVFQHQGVKPKSYLNQSLDLITSDFHAGNIDAAAAWEPTASRLVDTGVARRVGSGDFLHLSDAAFIVMSKQLLDKRPDIARDWLKAELDAERFLANPANASAVAQMAVSQTTGFTQKDMHDALYRAWPQSLGGPADGTKLSLPFTVGPAEQALIRSATAFLYRIHAIGAAQLPPGAVDGSVAQQVLSQQGASSPVGVVHGTAQGGS